MPLIEHPVSGRPHIDCHALSMSIAMYANAIEVAVVEDVHARPGQGVTSMFRFGVTAGAIQGVLAALMVPSFYVTPNVWKHLMHLSSDKNLSREKAKVVAPEFADRFARVKDDGRAEALMIAVYGSLYVLKS